MYCTLYMYEYNTYACAIIYVYYWAISHDQLLG